MAQRGFGQTWWGSQWLQALQAVDWNNRLPRGRRYANNGSVRSLSLDDGMATAKVKGSRAQPYRVQVSLLRLPVRKLARLLDDLAADPVLIGQLLNRTLDPAVQERAAAHGVALFPRSWRDLKMHCSCPDGAVPCKHLAAVIYLLAREIDADPFQVFRLRGVDLIAELERRGLHLAAAAEAALPDPHGLLSQASVTLDGPPAADVDRLRGIDYAHLRPLRDSLLQALPDEPGFAAAPQVRQAWKTQMGRLIRRARSELGQLTGDAAHEPGEAPALAPDAAPRLVLDKALGVKIHGARDCADLADLSAALAELRADDLGDYDPPVGAWYAVRMAALHLLAAGAAVPRLFQLARGETGAIWLPAAPDPEVQSVLRQLAQGLPAGLLRLHKGRRYEEMPPMAQALAACGLLMDHAIRQCADLPASQQEDKTLALLFGAGRARFDRPGEGGTAERMHLWLSRLQLAERDYLPVLRLTERRNHAGFNLHVDAEDRRPEARGGKPTPLKTVLTRNEWRDARGDLLQTIGLLGESYPPLNDYVARGGKRPLALEPEAMPELLETVFPALRLLGIRILMPRALERMLRPRLSVKMQGKDSQASSGLLDSGSLFDFDWRVALGDEVISAEEFETLVRTARGVVRFRGEYVFLDPAEIDRLRKQLDNPQPPAGAEGVRIALAGEYQGAPVQLDEQARDHIRRLTETPEVPLPAALEARLRPYQRRGFAWLYRNARAGLGSIIADDMGLGKTLQVIAAIARLKEDGELEAGKALIIVPTSLLTNWQRELERFAPGLGVVIFHGPQRRLAHKARPDILLTSYGVARSDAARLKKLPWRLLAVDESQNIKNPAAQQTRAVKSIPAGATIAMSGTPVENRLLEYWSVMDLVNRGYLGPAKRFEEQFGKPIQVDGDERIAERFRRVTAPFIMRRLKSDKRIISDLPDKISQDQYCELTAQQTAVYETVVREAMQVIEGTSDTFQRQGLVLQMILALKQVCNHPAQYLKQAQPAIDGSGKARRLLELLDAAHRQHEKVLVFTQFREMGDILRQWIGEHFASEPAFLHGGVTRKRRDAMVSRFQEHPYERVLLLSLKAGGTGLNLTAASQVIHYDLWWNPAVENQATDRAYRIGQTRTVQVHRLLTRDTFEERINDMIQAKRGLAEMTVGTGEQWIGQLSDRELHELFTLGAG